MPTKDEIVEFSLLIENLSVEKSVPYMEAVILHCERTGLELEVAARLISGVLKAKIQTEAEELNFLPKANTAKLPL